MPHFTDEETEASTVPLQGDRGSSSVSATLMIVSDAGLGDNPDLSPKFSAKE